MTNRRILHILNHREFKITKRQLFFIKRKAVNGKVVYHQSIREELSPAESSSGQGLDEVHPGADSVSALHKPDSLSRVK